MEIIVTQNELSSTTLFFLTNLPRYLGSCALNLAYCSAVMHVHCGSLALLGEAGVLNGFLLVLNFCLLGGSNFNEYEDEAFLENLNEGDCNISHYD